MKNIWLLKAYCAMVNFQSSFATRFMTSLQVTLGFSSSQIGCTLGVLRLATSLLSPSVSSYADVHGSHKRMIMVQSAVRVIPLMLMWLAYSSHELSLPIYWLLNGLISLLSTGITPVSDSLILASLPDKEMYGQIRLWGALAYGFGNFVLGAILLHAGNFNPMFALSLICLFPALAAMQVALPSTAAQAVPTTPATLPSVRPSVWFLLSESPSVKIFFLNAVVVGSALSLVESLLFIAMERSMHGSSPLIAGASVLISVLFELPIFHMAPALLTKYGTKHMMIVANLAWIIRGLGYAMFESAWIVLVLEVLHGVTFGLFYTAGVHICMKNCRPGMESTSQALFDMTFGGVGVALGSLGGGFLFDAIGTSETFLLFAGLLAVSTLGLIVVFKEESPSAQLSHQLTSIQTSTN